MSSGELRGTRINEEVITPNSLIGNHGKTTSIVTTLPTGNLPKIDPE